MILAIDVGNTNIVIGGFSEGELTFVSRISTLADQMQDEYSIKLKQILEFHHCSPALFDGAIISCVVPPLLPTLKKAVAKLLNCTVLVASPGIKTGMNIRIDNPASLGSDLVCGAVAAIKKYRLPCIVLDMGTATKFSAIDAHGNFIGASIMPGINISLNALSANTAQLPYINLEDSSVVIGKNTIDSMKSGIVFGSASMVDGMIEKFTQAIGEPTYVVATGGLAATIIPHCNSTITLDPTLILQGLYIIYCKNCGTNTGNFK